MGVKIYRDEIKEVLDQNSTFREMLFKRGYLLTNGSFDCTQIFKPPAELVVCDLDAYDIELKSWASEVVRVFLERKYEIKMPETLNERQLSIFLTRFFGHPKLMHCILR